MAIFLTGATGFIGGAVARRFVDNGHSVRGLARTPEKASQLAAMGVEPVLGSLSDADLLTAEAGRADAVIHCARAEEGASARALLNGLRGSGKTYVQTSGTGIVATPGDGDTLTSTVYDDGHAHLNVPPARQSRFEVDKGVMAAAGEDIRTIVICPPSIYGHSRGPKKNSSQIPFLLNHARTAGAVTIVGQGINRWSQVHIDDLVDLYLLAYDKAQAGSFYFGSNGEASFRDLADALEGRLQLGPVRSIPVEDAEQLWGSVLSRLIIGGNSRVLSKRAPTELAWRPSHDSAVEWIRNEMEL
jgi:nucleoside-diphosphate-sugar epimerase